MLRALLPNVTFASLGNSVVEKQKGFPLMTQRSHLSYYKIPLLLVSSVVLMNEGEKLTI